MKKRIESFLLCREFGQIPLGCFREKLMKKRIESDMKLCIRLALMTLSFREKLMKKRIESRLPRSLSLCRRLRFREKLMKKRIERSSSGGLPADQIFHVSEKSS